MKTFKYKGKVRTAANNQLLFPGCEYSLPETDPHVASLAAQGLLVAVEQPAPIKTEPEPSVPDPVKTFKSKK